MVVNECGDFYHEEFLLNEQDSNEFSRSHQENILKAINFKDKGAVIQTFEAKIPVRKYV